jgi:hypothetical protein
MSEEIEISKRTFLTGSIMTGVGIASGFLSTNAIAKSNQPISQALKPQTIDNKGEISSMEDGSMFWHDKVLYVKLSENEIDQIYPAIARYA